MTPAEACTAVFKVIQALLPRSYNTHEIISKVELASGAHGRIIQAKLLNGYLNCVSLKQDRYR